MLADPPLFCERVKANATVEMLKFGRKPYWRVTVKGLAPHDDCRVYMFKAKSEKEAAFAGIDLFVTEMGGGN